MSTTEFSVVSVEAKIAFSPVNNENVEVLKLHQGGRIMDAPRVGPFDTSALKLPEFTGRFYSEELSTAYHFSVVGEKLIAQHSRLSDIELNPIKEDMFSGNICFFGQTELIRDVNNVIIGCKVSSGRIRNLWFQKVD